MSYRSKLLLAGCAALTLALLPGWLPSPPEPKQVTFPEAKGDSQSSAGIPGPGARTLPALFATHSTPAEGIRVPGNGADPVRSFDDWFRQFSSGDGRDRSALHAEGIALAKRRLAALRNLMVTNPEAALAAAVPWETRQQLPVEFQQYLETPVNTRAIYTVTIGDDPDHDRLSVNRSADVGGTHFDVFTYGRMAEQGTATNLPVNGIAIGNSLALADSPIRILSPAESAATRDVSAAADPVCVVSGGASVTPGEAHWVEAGGERFFVCRAEHLNQLVHEWTTDPNGKWVKIGKGSENGGPKALDSWSQGPKTVLFIRVNFPDDLTEAITESAAYDLMNNVSEWVVANSYGSSSMITTVTPLLTLPNTKAFYSQIGDGQLLADARTVAKQAGYDTSDFNFDAVRFTSVPGYSYSGQAYVRGKGVWLQSSSVGVACHEFGHNYGLWHANYWNASQASIIGPGSHQEYGDIFDTMGSASAGDKYFNTNHRNKIDWLGDNYVRAVTGDGTYRLHAFDVNQLTAGRFYALRIYKDYDRDYWLELRHLFAGNPWIQNGVLVRWDPWAGSAGGAHLLDTTPGSPAANSSKDDAALVVGRTFVDEGAGIHVTPIAINGTGADKSVDLVVHTGNFPGNHPPTVALQASATQASPSGAIVFTAAAHDDEGDALAYEWDFGDQTFGPNSAVVTNAWTVAGEYVVRCRVSDMKGGFGSAQTIVQIGNTSTFRIAGRITDEAGNPVEGVRVSNGSTSAGTYRGGFTDSDGHYVITRLAAGSQTVVATLYGFTFSPAGGWSNPVTVGPDQPAIDLVGTRMPVVGWEIIDGDAGEAGPNPATIRLSRTGPTTSSLTVKYNRSGTATYSSDYSLAPAPGSTAPYSISIPAGQSYVDVTLTPIQDTLAEGPETVLLTLAEDATYKIGWRAEARIDIVDDELPGKPSVSVSSSADDRAVETGSDTMSFTVNRTGSRKGDLVVHYTLSGTATPGVDYMTPSGTAIIPDGETSVAVTFAAIDDDLVEGDETVVINLTPDPAYSIVGGTTVLTIQDDDPPLVKLLVTDDLAIEGGAATAKVVVQRIGSTIRPLTVNYSTSGTATPGSDYTALPGSITIPAGASSATITVTALNDTVTEGDESVAIILTGSPLYNIGSPGTGVIVIQDNELPTVTLTATDATATEGGTDNGTFTISRGGFSTGDLQVFLSVSGQATPNADYAALPPSVTIPDGSTSTTLDVIPVDDGINELDEKVTLTLLPSVRYNVGTTGPVSVTIKDNDTAASVAVGFESPGTNVSESQTSVKLPVVLSAPSSTAVTVNYAVVGGTAQNGTDFNLAAGTLTFSANQTLATINFSLVNDSLAEADETIVLQLSTPTGAVLDTLTSHTVTITDDDACVVTVAATAGTAAEGGASGNFRISRTGGNSKPATVLLQFSGTAASPSDYQILPLSVTLPAGVDYVDLPVVPVDDATPEMDESVVVRLTSVTGGRVGSPATATVVIKDNDNPPTSFAAWQLIHFTTQELSDPATSGPSADPDGDGLNNFAEYAFNKNPNQAEATPVVGHELDPINGSADQLLVVTYRRRITRSDVRYVLGVSGDLGQWDESSSGIEEISTTPDGDGMMETVRAEVLAPLSHFDRRFVRLRVLRQ